MTENTDITKMRDPRDIGKEWMRRIRQSESFDGMGEWLRDAEEAETAYLQAAGGEAAGKVYDFNILHSNVETIGPSVFNSTPVADVRERFRAGDVSPDQAVARVVSQVIERAISVQVDDGALDTELEAVVQDILVAGRGILRVRFDADEVKLPPEPVMDDAGLPLVDEEGVALDPETLEPMKPQIAYTNERLIYEAVSWRDYREGPAKRWRDVPWVAYREKLAYDEVQRIRDPKLRDKLTEGGEDGDPDNPVESDDVDLWEIWDKDTRCVYVVAEASHELIRKTPDPLGLKGFFPNEEPIQPIKATGRRTPVVPFKIYRALADELERLTRRIRAITEGLKVKGIVVGDASALEELAEVNDDNVLIPVANLEGLAQTGGLDKAISWWPIDKAVAVLRELYVARDQTKATIYEVTGISDIVRGASEASETATAQQIKNQWGSLRIRKLQRMVERGVRKAFVLSAELISQHFSVETLQRMTQLAIPPEAAQLLQNPLDHYRIDVESDSTVRADLTLRRQEMSEFLTGTAEFFGTMAPVVQQAPQIAGPITELFAAFARQFNLGKQAEDAIEQIATIAKQSAEGTAQQAQQPDPATQAKAEKDMAEADKTRLETELMASQPMMPPEAPPPA